MWVKSPLSPNLDSKMVTAFLYSEFTGYPNSRKYKGNLELPNHMWGWNHVTPAPPYVKLNREQRIYSLNLV